ncbi:MAG: PorV/PorQ family protein [Candidatus Latescibacterota bacterium]|jgi:hypothetical protein
MRLITALLLAIPTLLQAQSGLPSLRLSAGAHPAAMADLGAALQGPDATNPAALAIKGTRAYTFSHNAWIEGIDQEHAHLVYKRAHSIWALRAQVWQADGLERRTGPSSEPLGEFGVYDLSTGVAYTRHLQSGLRVGGQLKFVRQSISTATASGWAIDLGVLHALSPHVDLGATLLNFGRMSKLERTSTPLPTEGRAGLVYSGIQRLRIGFEAQKARASDLSLHVGGQYQANSLLALRLGYQTSENRHLSAGLGLRVGTWTIDYAYIPFSSGLGEAHRLSLQLDVGRTSP